MPSIRHLIFPSHAQSPTVEDVTDSPALDRRNPEEAIDAAAKRCSNWGRWGTDDVLGTLNFLDDAKRVEGAGLVRRGVSFSLSQSFDMNGPQKGWRRRTNPVHTMLDTGTDAERGSQGFPHGLGGADDVIAMPLQASTQWDGLGHIFDHGNAWNGRHAGDVVTSEGDAFTGIETVGGRMAGRGVLLDVGRVLGATLGTDGELPDGFAITTEHLEATIAAQGESSRVGRGDLVVVRTGRLARARRDIAEGRGWGDYAGGDSPGLSFTTADWLHGTEIAGIATDTWGFEVRPNEFDVAFQPLHQVAIPNIGLFIGEMWDLDALAADCAADGRYDFWLTAAPLPVTGAVGAPVNPIAVK
jgi:kynurenine formamidase